MLYYNIDADKHEGTAKKTTLAEFGIEPAPTRRSKSRNVYTIGMWRRESV